MKLRVRVSAVVVSLLCIGWSVLADEKYDPFRIPKQEFFSAVDTVALWPVQIYMDAPERNRARVEIEDLLTASLEEHGYAVVPSQQLERRWERYAEWIGGVFDPVTGEADRERLAIVRDLVYQELALELHVDAVVVPSVTHGRMTLWVTQDPSLKDSLGSFGDDSRVWMAGDEPVRWRGVPLVSFYAHRPQRVRGLRFSIRIFDSIGAKLYDIMTPVRWSRIYLMGSYEERPDPLLGTLPERMREVIETAVEPMARPEGCSAGRCGGEDADATRTGLDASKERRDRTHGG